MDQKTFILETKKLGLETTPEIINQLEKYKNKLIECNKKFNLTSITETKDIYLKHFYDSLTVVKAVDLNNVETLLDIGTGAGFPGIVLKIYFPHLKITLLDSNHKKINFLKELINELNLTNINCIWKRVEDLPIEYRESFDITISRAVARLRILCELEIPFTKVGGLMISLKSSDEEELKECEKTLKKLNSHIEKTIEFNLPIENSKRSIICIKKDQKTNLKYPRNYNIIKKKSL